MTSTPTTGEMVTCTGTYAIDVDEQAISTLGRITNIAEVSGHVRIFKSICCSPLSISWGIHSIKYVLIAVVVVCYVNCAVTQLRC